jgi:hypothetical protein
MNEPWKFTPETLAMYLDGRQASKNPYDVGLDKITFYEWARLLGFSDGRDPTWPFGTHSVDGVVWNVWVRACANHTLPTRGTCRELGLKVSSNW